MEMTIVIGLALAVLVFFLFKFLTPSKTKKNLLPQPWRIPILGHMHHLIGTIPHRGVTELARKYGPLMHLQLGEVSTIVVSSPRWAKEILTTYDITFADRPETLTGEIVAYHNTDIVFSPYGEHWRHLRKICTLELLNTKKVKSFQSLREEECWSLVNEIKASGSGKPIDLSKCISILIARIVSRATFGKGIKDEVGFREIVRETVQLTGGFDIADIFPSKKVLHHLSGKRAKLTKIHNKLATLINNIISDHPGSQLSSSQESLLDVLLRHKDDAEFPLTSDTVKAVIFDMFGAGTDTSHVTIEWAISELIKCPRAMEKLQVKLREAIKGKERIQEEDIQDLMYLKNVIKETLRLHPPLPLLIPRECREPCVIDGYDIPKKTKLLVNVFAINRDPEYWKDPESFIPERFENSPINIMGSEYEYLPFGGGRRRCPGASMGLANIELPLANLLCYFNWKLPDGASHEELDMTELFGAAIQRKTRLVLVPMFQEIVDGSR
ncbi:germacrene A oxidase-like [Cynara cardunculus var. scolymus]|uniref:Cytochrome P450 n=1 Tax=Cynara cardunculus var. scolymus TaxID=59895 RepID=A0A103Y5V1_CYNCS|nr:germacrene A oxidase-like [Cynara cardunculus var. scolymus]KVI03097.1 cytochrome P450 [Cynara cardunculus var. scolymus]